MKRIISIVLTIAILAGFAGALPVSAAENNVTYLDMSANALPAGYTLSNASSSFSSDSLHLIRDQRQQILILYIRDISLL